MINNCNDNNADSANAKEDDEDKRIASSSTTLDAHDRTIINKIEGKDLSTNEHNSAKDACNYPNNDKQQQKIASSSTLLQ